MGGASRPRVLDIEEIDILVAVIDTPQTAPLLSVLLISRTLAPASGYADEDVALLLHLVMRFLMLTSTTVTNASHVLIARDRS